ncbi:MAG: hypothetical protein GY696_27055 [Gammaproteobacteria bacterium]|nr:hypothetical protein [Gammaproteobacteria bacterium]
MGPGFPVADIPVHQVGLADWGKANAFLIENPPGNPKDLPALVSNAATVDDAAQLLTTEILDAQREALSDRAAIKEIHLRRPSCPWMTKQLFRIIQRNIQQKMPTEKPG